MKLRNMLEADRAGWRGLSLVGLIPGVILSLVYLHFFAFQAHVEFNIDISEHKRGWFRIYWADENTAYTEENMRQVLVDSKNQHYSLFIGNLADISRLRIDPVEFETKIFLHWLSISQTGFEDIILNPLNRFEGLEPVKEIDRLVAKEDGLRFNTTGRDAQFELKIDTDTAAQFPLAHVVAVLAIIGGSLLFVRLFGFLSINLGYVPILLLIAVVLSLIMAVISRDYWIHNNGVSRIFVHPDEEAHTTAIEYYRDHWLPPAVDDPEIRDSYSIYGYTRLASFELYYPIAGYFSRLLEPFRTGLIWNARLFGVLLFGVMAWMAWRHVPFRPFALPLLLSPQIWYLYSYANSDGFALILATVAAYQAAYPGSTMNRLLSDHHPRFFWPKLLLVGLLAGALFLLKLNFYFFILFIGFYFLWRVISGDFPDQKLFWKRLVLIGVVGCSIYGLRAGLDIMVNGIDSKAKQRQMVEETARPLYKPSTPLAKKHIYLYMRDRGFSLSRILRKEKWAGKTFVSSFGAYGYTQYLGGPVYYGLVKIVGVVMLATLLLAVLIYAPIKMHWLFTLSIGAAFMLIAASLWQSWTVSFQAQGRYLAPILPMLGVFWYHLQPSIAGRVPGWVLDGLVLALFALGVYSFVFVGLNLIPKFA